LAVAVAAVLALASSGSAAAPRRTDRGVSGHFSLILMVHTLGSIPEYSVPATHPWSGALESGATYSYRSIPCTGNAPLNNISTDLPSYGSRVVGSRPPVSVRGLPFAFKLQRVKKVWQMRGSISLAVCKLSGGPNATPDPVPDVSKPKIVFAFAARFTRMTPEEIEYRGTFRIAGGTGRYADLTGSGTIAGYLFCFAAEGCAAKGSFQDNQMVLQGSYHDPTPQLTTPG
jgi:hypothetical protein